MIDMVAAADAVPVATLIRSILLPAVREKAADEMGIERGVDIGSVTANRPSAA